MSYQITRQNRVRDLHVYVDKAMHVHSTTIAKTKEEVLGNSNIGMCLQIILVLEQ